MMQMNKKAIQDIYPLTPLQEGLLFHTVYEPDSQLYFEQLSCTLKGDLDVTSFGRAWQEVVDRHSIFRTGFNWDRRSAPFQVVYGSVRLPVDHLDVRGQPASEQGHLITDYLRSDRERGFSLTRPPLM